MTDSQFEYGPISRGIYLALIPAIALTLFFSWEIFGYYLLLLLFLGIGLKPLLLKTGIHALFQHTTESAYERLHKKHAEKLHLEVERKIRDNKYRGGYRKDSRLPKNW